MYNRFGTAGVWWIDGQTDILPCTESPRYAYASRTKSPAVWQM